jgi:hypothetical protein
MKKLKLDLDVLKVQSFDTGADSEAAGGTVLAFQKGQGTGPNDSNCSCIDACPSALGCTQFGDCETLALGCDSLKLGC